MPPLYLVTLFLPHFYGVLDVHGWGVALEGRATHQTVVSGGLFVMTAVLTALFALRSQQGQGGDRRQRVWTWIGLVLLVGSLFTMMGRFTPVFMWLCEVLPWFFRFPHAVYYRFAACWSVALLAGIGVSTLIAAGRGGPRLPDAGLSRDLPWYGRWPAAALCIALACMAVVVGLWWRVDSLRGYEALSLYREWRWFVTRPGLHLAVASTGLLVLFTVLAPRRRGWALALGVAAETVLLASYMLYVTSMLSQDRRQPPHWSVENGAERRFTTLADFSHHRLLSTVRPLLEQPSVRVATSASQLDNQAWAVDGRALLGCASKPLLPRFEKAIEPFVTGLPYNLVLQVLSPAFMRNMNVGYFIAPEQRSPRWPVVARLDGAAIYRLDTPLPWVYTQDRVVAADDERQLEALQSGDLREAVLVDPELAARLPTGGIGDAAAFVALQATNRILSVDRSRPNRLTVEAELGKPAMLVIVECWHPGWSATVDGRETPVWQVNYLQQGLWLEAGRHTVELKFMPQSVRRGVVVSGVSAVLVLLVAGVGWRNGRKGRNGQNGRNGAAP